MGDSAAQPYVELANGAARLFGGEALALLAAQPTQSVDLVFADPPYFLSGGGTTCQAGRRVKVDKGGWDKPLTAEALLDFNRAWLSECQRILRADGCLWVSGTQHNIHAIGYALQLLGFKLLGDIAWHKVNPPPNLSCRYFTHATETLLWAAPSIASRHCFNYAELKAANGGKQMTSLWSITRPGRSETRHGKHPTQKPLALLDRIIRASSLPGQLVLDPFCGSGTTGVAALALGRRFVGFELEPDFLALAAARLAEAAERV